MRYKHNLSFVIVLGYTILSTETEKGLGNFNRLIHFTIMMSGTENLIT